MFVVTLLRMARPVTILVDHTERQSRVPLLLADAGVRVESAPLGVADYLVADGWGVERKTSRDLGRSILNGRLWQQVARLRTLPRPYLVIEGQSLSTPGVARAGVQGALLQVVENGVVVLWSQDPEDTARWLVQLGKRACRSADGESTPRRRRTGRVTTSVGLLSTVSGVTPATAELLLEKFGSVAGIAAASVDDLMRIPGLGPKRAANLKHVL